MKNLFYILFLCLTTQTFGQSIPNNNFDDWYFGGIDRLWHWGNSEGCATGDSHMAIYYVHGDFGVDYSDPAVQLRTWVDANDSVRTSFIYAGYQNFTNWQTGECEVDFIRSGQPFPYRPTKMDGFYKFRNDSLITNDYGRGMVILRKTNPVNQSIDTIGYGYVDLHPTPTDTVREPFEVNITYLSSETPDTIVVAFLSTATQQAGGVLVVDSLTFDFTSSVEQIVQQNVFSIAPNPVHDFLNINIRPSFQNERFQYSIFDISGRVLKQGRSFSSMEQIDVSDFAKGMYFIRLENERIFEVAKFLK